MTGEKKVILEMYASGAALHEIVAHVDRPPGVVINYLVREGIIAHPTSYDEARKTLPEMNKRLNACGLTFANVSGGGFSLADWAAYYKKPLVDVFEAAVGAGPGDIQAKLKIDMQVLRERQTEIDRTNAEFNERMKPIHYFREVKAVWARLYERQAAPPTYFREPKTLSLIYLRISGDAGSELFLRAVEGLTQDLAGFLSGKDCKRHGSAYDHLPEIFHDQQNSWDENSSIHIGLEISLSVNIKVLDEIVKAWSNKFCFVLKTFQYVSRELKLSCALDLDQVVMQKLEDGEK